MNILGVIIIIGILRKCYGSEGNQASNQEGVLRNSDNVEANPCETEIVKPNFERPGRRKSETKCLEYIWEMNEKSYLIIAQVEKCNAYKFEMYMLGKGPRPWLDMLGGYVVKPMEIPHMAAIGWRSIDGGWIFQCGATIISPKFVLTAAHCTKSRKDSRISNQVPEIVRIGTVVLKPDQVHTDSAKNVEIARIIQHPEYKPPKKYFDIALIEFKKSEHFNYYVAPVCLWTSFDMDKLGTEISSSGWGVTKEGGQQNSNSLMAGNLDIVNQTYCHRLLQPMANRNWWGLADHQMCAGLLGGGVDTCQGDSGGPLQAPINLKRMFPTKAKMYYLLGVTSFGFGCARKNSPGVYTRVASFIDWIEENVWPNESTNATI